MIGSTNYLKPLAYTPEESEEIRLRKRQHIWHLISKSGRGFMSWRTSMPAVSYFSTQCGLLPSSCFKNIKTSWECSGLLGLRCVVFLILLFFDKTSIIQLSFRLKTCPGALPLVKPGTLWPSRCTTCRLSPSGHSSWSSSSSSLGSSLSGWSSTGWWPSATLWRPQTRPSMRRRSGSRISNSLTKSRTLVLLSQGADGRR